MNDTSESANSIENSVDNTKNNNNDNKSMSSKGRDSNGDGSGYSSSSTTGSTNSVVTPVATPVINFMEQSVATYTTNNNDSEIYQGNITSDDVHVGDIADITTSFVDISLNPPVSIL